MENNTKLTNGLSFIFNYIKKYWFALIIILAFIVLATYLQVQTPLMMSDAIDALGSYLKAYFTKQATEEPYNKFIEFILQMVLAYGLLCLSMFMYSFLMAGVAARSSKKIREVLFDKLQRLSIRFFDESNDGDILSRFTNDVDNISTLLNQAFVQIISSLALIFGISYSMFNENFNLACIVVGLALLTIIAIIAITRIAKRYLTKQQASLGLLNGYIDEKISGQKLIITTGTEEETYQGFIPFNEEYREISRKGQAYSNMLFPLVNGVSLVAIGLVIYFGIDLVIDNTLTIGTIVAFITYIQRFFQPIVQIVQQYSVFRLGVTGASRADEILEQPEDVVDASNAQDIRIIENKVEIKDVTFAYNKPDTILKNVNISLEKGKKIALVGPTGSGKTTIMNLLNRFYDVDEGSILFDGVNIKEIKLQSLRKNVGIVLQDTVLFSGSIKDNIGYGKKNVSDEDIVEAAKTANIHDYIMSLDEGYDTKVDNSNSIFSVGQKQLISIARTIITNPDLLILDEATSNVDTVTEAHIQEAINSILVGRTSFVIAHRLKTILDADKIVVLKDGEVIEQGTHEQLLSLDGFYAELYSNQFVPNPV